MSAPDHELSRRRFLQLAGLSGLGVALTPSELMAQYRFLAPIKVDNPLAAYPNRDWERMYRDIYRHDRTFTFLCAPNDTHNCLLQAFVKNNILVRIEPTFGYGKATDVYGNRASHRWDPRCCQKGLVLGRRQYGDRRVKGAFVRRGFKAWVERGFPRDPATGQVSAEYLRRGWDGYVKVGWEEAFDLHARALVNIAETYSGGPGAARLEAQGYDPVMVERVEGAGTRTLKVRGGMPFLGALRLCGIYRFGNMLALLDAKVRGVGPEEARGGIGWDNYAWHTDTPPGHPMVCGEQTNDFDLFAAEHAKLIIPWGMNWISTKMPDGHWLTEARLRGARIVVVTVEYSSTANKADEVVVIRPGTDPAFALGLAQVIIKEGLHDEAFVKRFTDLPILVRMDTLTPLKASEVFAGHADAALARSAVVGPGDPVPTAIAQDRQLIPAALRAEWGDAVVWDAKTGQPRPLSRDDVGDWMAQKGIDPALSGTWEVTTTEGKKVQVRTVFDLTRELLDQSYDPETVSRITWAPVEAILALARQIAANPESTLVPVGMGPNQFFNADLKDRAIFLVLALTRNLGFLGGNVGSYAGNYRLSFFNGMPLYLNEDPFNPQLDPAGPVSTAAYRTFESLHYLNYGDRVLREGTKLFTGQTHTPTPTKAMWLANTNSAVGNIKWHYDFVFNTLMRVECLAVNEWWWTGSCEYADVVYGVDSWMEFKVPDMTASCTNPFVQVFPRTPLRRSFDTRGDIEAVVGVSAKLAELTEDRRFLDYWKFIVDEHPEIYLQRILDASTTTRGFQFEVLEAKARLGVPALAMTRTYPRATSWEQVHESRPWYTKTGRLEFYRGEPEFIESGENLIVYREPSDSTFFEPNVIVANPHPALRPTPPEGYGFSRAKLDHNARQARHVVVAPAALAGTSHPLVAAGFRYVFHTPKYRHGSHTTPVDTDIMANFFGPFGDIYRRDKRSPHVGEMYVDIHPLDGKELGVQDGDYVWIDGDPETNPFRGAEAEGRRAETHVARLLCRARYYPGTPQGIMRMWFNGYQASPGSVRGHESRSDGLAKNPGTNYQAMFRYGGHQSATRAWLKPTLMTDSLVRRNLYGQTVGKGYHVDVHSAIGAPREAFVKVAHAEAGGIGGVGLWRPVALGLRPANESAAMKRYLAGDFVVMRKA
jgi:nitrate reductase / nitrite oxidoreductase, alpha subunit